jgi:hypothetical protein
MMRHGIVKCKCGYEMYFETKHKDIVCLMCNTTIDVSAYPFKEEVDEDDTRVQAGSDL